MKKYLRAARAFTILETIIAVTVIGLVITAAAQLTQSSLNVGRSTIRQFVAAHLAEEGLEIVRNLRDSNWLQNLPAESGLKDGLYVIVANAPGGPPWRLEKIRVPDDAPEISMRESGRFRRAIVIAGMRVTSTAVYREIRGEKSVGVTMQLTDWKKGPL